MSIESVGDFLKVVKACYGEDSQAYFRGQSSSSFDVSSSIYRFIQNSKSENDADNFGYRLTQELFKNFCKNMPVYSEVHELDNYTLNELDLLMVAQHYGLSTRLIDLTKNPLVALYFATESVEKNDSCSVFMLYNTPHNPIAISSSNDLFMSIKQEQKILSSMAYIYERNLVNGSSTDLADEFHKLTNNNDNFIPDSLIPPVMLHDVVNSKTMAMLTLTNPREALHGNKLLNQDRVNYIKDISVVTLHNQNRYVIEPLPINPRIRNQQGLLLFSRNFEGVEYRNEEFDYTNIVTTSNKLNEIDYSKGFIRIDIEYENAKAIHQELQLYGITEDFIYPEITSFTKVLHQKVLTKVKT